MIRRKWSSEEELKIVLEGLSGKIEIAKLCNKYQIYQVIDYCQRDQLLRYGHQAFESKKFTKREQRLSDENQHLKQIIGDLTIELKKSEFV